MEILRDDVICPMVDRIPGTLSMQCIGQQIMLDIMDALFQFTLALYSPKGKQRLQHVAITQQRLEDLQSCVSALRTRTKRFDKNPDDKKRARIVTGKQYADFLEKTTAIFAETETMRARNEEYAAQEAATAASSQTETGTSHA